MMYEIFLLSIFLNMLLNHRLRKVFVYTDIIIIRNISFFIIFFITLVFNLVVMDLFTFELKFNLIFFLTFSLRFLQMRLFLLNIHIFILFSLLRVHIISDIKILFFSPIFLIKISL